MKKDILFEQKEVVVTCEKKLGNTDEYYKLLRPPIKHKKI
jgi:hypothetical protein